MNREPVLIAALSGRALAASASRAGYRPVVVDCFGDADLATAPGDSCCLPAGVRAGFRRSPLIDALDNLQSRCTTPARGLILGTGFEDQPNLIARLADRYPILGSDADTIAAVKDPAVFFPLLKTLGIGYPETQLNPPNDASHWLRKRTGGSGGLHIRPCSAEGKARKHHYFQARVDGQAVSVLAVVGKGGTAFALSKQWCAPARRTPFRYGGAVSNIVIHPDHEGEILEAALAITEAAGLVGLASIDFIIGGDEILCLEVNPRPGATLEVHDDEHGALFEAHLIACAGGDPADFLQNNWASHSAKAAAILYADQGPVTIEIDSWPDWVSDRPKPGTTSALGQPLASVHAEAQTAEEAEQLCKARLAGLEKMLYDSKKGKE